MSRQYTEEEVSDKILEHIWHSIQYWEKESRAETTRAKMEGVAFSILTMLDGANVDIPGFIVAPFPCVEDRPYNEDRGENWWPENIGDRVDCDLGGGLHDRFHEVGRRLGYLPAEE